MKFGSKAMLQFSSVACPLWARSASFIIGGVLVTAALAKVFAPAERFSLFGAVAHAVPWVSWAVVAAELLLGGWLISGWRIFAAVVLALLLLAIFTGAIAHDMTLRYPVPCGCFGRVWQQVHEPAAIERGLVLDLWRNVLLLGFLGAVLVVGLMPRPAGGNWYYWRRREIEGGGDCCAAQVKRR